MSIKVCYKGTLTLQWFRNTLAASIKHFMVCTNYEILHNIFIIPSLALIFIIMLKIGFSADGNDYLTISV